MNMRICYAKRIDFHLKLLTIMDGMDNRKYSREHTWVRLEGENAIIGITDFAQSELGEIVYVDMPNVGAHFKQDEVFGQIEAVKTTSDLFLPVSGTVVEINKNLLKKADLVNSNPFDEGWIIRISITDIGEMDRLLTEKQYQEMYTK